MTAQEERHQKQHKVLHIITIRFKKFSKSFNAKVGDVDSANKYNFIKS